MTSTATLVTGATGFIGAEVLRRLTTRERERRVYALVRASDDQAAERRGREVLFRLFHADEAAAADAAGRIRWITGDLARPDLGLSNRSRQEIVAECGEVIHAAASTDWDLPLDQAEAVNFTGVTGIADLVAERLRSGRDGRLVHISTAYVSGRRTGQIEPEDLPGPGEPFNNTYEETKAKAERYLRERMGEIPVTVLRPSIVVGDSLTGRTFNFNVLYFPIKLLYRGLLPIVPGRASTRLDIVPVDYVCDATIALGRDPLAIGCTYHLTADDDAMPLREFGERIARFFNEQFGADRPVIRPPRLVGPAAWRVIRLWLGWRLKGRPKQQFDAFNIYLPYIMTSQRFGAASARRALAGRIEYPKIESYILRVAEYAVTREWGQEVSWDTSGLPDHT